MSVSWKETALYDTDIFSEEVLGYKNPKHIKSWYKALDELKPDDRYIRMAPRGHAKTETHTVNYALRRVTKNPNLIVTVISNTIDQSIAMLSEIKLYVESEKYQELYGQRADYRQWSATKIRLKRDIISKDPTISVGSVEGSIISKRSDLIILDDIIDPDNVKTANQRKKVIDWFWGVVVPVLKPGGQIIIVGTRWHYNDLYSKILKKKKWIRYVDKAILDFDTKEVLWIEAFSYDDLIAIKDDSGSILFNCNYQNDPSGMKGEIFKYEWIKFYESVDAKKLDVFFGVDPAIGEKVTSDYFVLMIIGIDRETGDIYVLDYVREHLTSRKQIQTILKKGVQFQAIKAGIESNVYQKALAQLVEEISTELRIYLPIEQIHTSKSKESRAFLLSGLFENGRIYLRKDMHELIEELVKFPRGEHDDLFDGLDFAVNSAKVKSDKKGPIIIAGAKSGDHISKSKAGKEIKTWQRPRMLIT